jgi:hypothetical protein
VRSNSERPEPEGACVADTHGKPRPAESDVLDDRLSSGQRDGQASATAQAASFENVAPTRGRHAAAESMRLETLAYFWLPGSLWHLFHSLTVRSVYVSRSLISVGHCGSERSVDTFVDTFTVFVRLKFRSRLHVVSFVFGSFVFGGGGLALRVRRFGTVESLQIRTGTLCVPPWQDGLRCSAASRAHKWVPAETAAAMPALNFQSPVVPSKTPRRFPVHSAYSFKYQRLIIRAGKAGCQIYGEVQDDQVPCTWSSFRVWRGGQERADSTIVGMLQGERPT